MTLNLELLGPSINREYSTQSIVDLEQYLHEPVARFDHGTSLSRHVSVIDAVAATANTAGIAHYDDSVVLDIEAIEDHVYAGSNALAHVTERLANVVATLADHVCRILRSDATGL